MKFYGASIEFKVNLQGYQGGFLKTLQAILVIFRSFKVVSRISPKSSSDIPSGILLEIQFWIPLDSSWLFSGIPSYISSFKDFSGDFFRNFVR